MAIYLHETIEATDGKVEEYLAGLRDLGLPAFNEWKLHIVGIYRNIFSSGNWPEVVAIWRIEDWQTYIWMMQEAGNIPGMVKWNAAAHGWRQRGFDRIFIPTDWSPTPPTQPNFKASGGILLQQSYRIKPGRGPEFASIMNDEVRKRAESKGLTLEFFWRNNYNQFEFLGMWSVPSWDAYAEYQTQRDADGGVQLPGFDATHEVLVSVDERILMPTAYSPLGGGEGVDASMPN